MRKLASVVEIESVEPIPDTERLSVATMHGKGWKVVVGRNDFRPGEKAVYFEIDSYLPNEERYAFLRDRCLRKFCTKGGEVLKEGLRIKTIKLRGVISQGLLMPLSAFPDIEERIVPHPTVVHSDDDKPQLVIDEFVESEDGEQAIAKTRVDLVGADVTQLLRVGHFDEVKAALAPAMGNPISAESTGSFPSYVPKTDEERIQNLVEYFTTMKDRTFEVTVKADGSSVTMLYAPNEDPEAPFKVCSRNLNLNPEKADGTKPLPWQMAFKYNVEEKLRKYWEESGIELALQGELVGPGIQSNRDMLTEHEWRVFKIWDITNQRYLLPSIAQMVCEDLGIPYVTVLAKSMPVFQKFANVDELLSFAEGKTERGNEREGVVFKTTDLPYRSFKAVSNRYLLKQAAKED